MKSVGYLLKRFPRLSETFVINELLALRERGVAVEVFSLRQPEPDQQTALLHDLDLPVWYLPDRSALRHLTVTRRDFSRTKAQERPLGKWLKSASPAHLPGISPVRQATMQFQATTLAALAQTRGIRHLHAHFASDATTAALLASRLSNLSFSFTAHAKDIYHRYDDTGENRALLCRKLREARFVVTVSEYNRRHLLELSGGSSTIHRLYNGVDLKRLSFHPESREAGHILAVGRLVEKKGFSDLLAACALLRERKVDFHCTVIGEGPEREALERQINELSLQGQVTLAGARPQPVVLKRMRRAAVFALPCVIANSGDRDGLPTVLLECLALGTPIVSTRTAGIPEIIADTGNWLIEPHRPEALAQALEEALAMNDHRRTEVGRQGRRRAEALFDLRVNAARLADWLAASASPPEPEKSSR